MPKTINSAEFRKMIISGARVLEINRAKVDSLNVFPVPDGDTGTNMSLTIQSAVKELGLCSSNRLPELCDAVAKGALKGARGNSGVILSQLFRGICSEIKKYDEITIKAFAKAMECGTQVAYGAVSKPKEGTMLTVARLMSEFAKQAAPRYKEFNAFLDAVIKKGEEALAKTPELLPVLKKAGVVDSGGMGLLCVYRGFLSVLNGEEVDESAVYEPETSDSEDAFGDNSDIVNLDLGEIEFAYCTEFFIINLKKQTTLADIDKLKEKLMTIGDSVICIGDLELVKVHVHTNNPGIALSSAVELGELDRVKIENMLEQNRALRAKREAEKKEMGMLAICAGDGLSEIFKDLLVDRVIEGGQTMNPSASDIADAVQRINAEHVFVFPNNKNIIMAAEQAQKLADRAVVVLPTRTIPQGITAMLNFDPEADADANAVAMLQAADKVSTGLVTFAARDSDFDGRKIKKGEILALENGKLVATGTDITKTTYRLARSMCKKDTSFITVISGCDVSEEDAARTAQLVQAKCPGGIEVTQLAGGQPVYYYIISVE